MPCPTLPLFKPVSVFLEVHFGIFVSLFRSVSVNRDTDYKPFSFRLSFICQPLNLLNLKHIVTIRTRKSLKRNGLITIAIS